MKACEHRLKELSKQLVEASTEEERELIQEEIWDVEDLLNEELDDHYHSEVDDN